MPAVSVIIVNHNGAHLLGDCLGSLTKQTYRDFEVVFVDNGSSDCSLLHAKEFFPATREVRLPRNLGFTGGNNEGIRHARGRYIVLLNNDTEAAPGFLEELVRAVERRPDIGMVAPKILNFYDREEIDSVGGLVLCADAIGQGRGRGEKDSGQYDGLDDILIPSGCAALYRKSMLDTIGLFDERFFAYCEDTDLGLRGRWAGWEAVSAPKAIIYHKYSASAGVYSATKMQLVERNHYLTAVKTLPLRDLLWVPFFTCYRYLLMIYAVVTRQGKGRAGHPTALIQAMIAGHFQAFLGLPLAVTQRWEKKTARSPAEIHALLAAHSLTGKQLILNK